MLFLRKSIILLTNKTVVKEKNTREKKQGPGSKSKKSAITIVYTTSSKLLSEFNLIGGMTILNENQFFRYQIDTSNLSRIKLILILSLNDQNNNLR